MFQCAFVSNVWIYFHRGNSKYHYYGIRVKPGSELTNVSDDGSPVAPRSQGTTKRTKAPTTRSENSVSSDNSNPPPTQVSGLQLISGRY